MALMLSGGPQGDRAPAGSGGDHVRLAFADLTALLRDVFVASGVGEDQAAILARNCALCQRDGPLSHGVFRMAGYRASLASGWVDGRATPVVERAGPAFLRVDARNGFAQPALDAARAQLVAMVREAGVAVLAIRNSHHFSALWPDVEPFALEGLVAVSTVAGLACVAPVPGAPPLFGTNPIAFAAPSADGEPWVFDLATSALSNGDLRLAAQAGLAVPEGAGVDRHGRASTDPTAILDGGALLPFGGHKGVSLALMVEILAAAVTGGPFSHEVDYATHPGAQTPRTGQLLIVIDPARGNPADPAARTQGLIAALHAAGVERLPGDRRYAARRRSEELGVELTAAQLADLRTWAGRAVGFAPPPGPAPTR